MGGRGSGGVPKPTTLKVLNGTRKDRINNAEPVPGSGAVTPPEWLDADARAQWTRLAPDLIDKGVLKPWDAAAFGLWCDAAARHAEAAQIIAEEGVIAIGLHGGKVKHPAVSIVTGYAQVMLSYGARFGLTPSDRSQLKVERSSAAPADRLLS